MFWNIILGFLGIVIGVLIVANPLKVLNFLGRSEIAEKLDERGFLVGGSMSWYQIVGIVIVAFSFLWMLGLTQRIITAIASIFFGGGAIK